VAAGQGGARGPRADAFDSELVALEYTVRHELSDPIAP
jgi:hypothetical protein